MIHFIITSIILFVSCKGKTDKLAQLAKYKNQQFNELKIVERPIVSAYLIDEARFKINGTQVGLQAFIKYDTPFVTWMMPEQADYIELLRCKADIQIAGLDRAIGDVEVGTMSKDAEVEEFKANNFWKSAEDSGACTLIGKDFNERHEFVDMASPSGNWRYIIRACVDLKRLADSKQAGSRNCSRQLGVSGVLSYYENKREKNKLAAMQIVTDQRSKMDAISRQIYSSTIDFNNALVECAKREKERIVSIKRRAAISQLVGLGVSFAANIFSASTSAISSMDTFNKIWNSRDIIAGASVPIGGMLMDLTASEDDYPRSCTAAEEARVKTAVLVTQLKAEHLVYATKLDESR